MRFHVKITDVAAADAEVIYGWIAERSPNGAWKWYQAYLAAADSLAVDPEQHPKAPEFSSSTRDVRELDFKTRRGRRYRMLFVIVGFKVHVLRVRGFGQAPVADFELGD